MRASDPVSPGIQESKAGEAFGMETETKESQEHQDKAFWSALEPFRPDEEASPDAGPTSDTGNPEGKEPEREGEWIGA